MTKFARIAHQLLALLFVLATMLRALPVAAQSHSEVAPAAEDAPSALFLPLAFSNPTPSQPVANPLTVAVTVDSGRVATETILIEGGTISVTAGNGTRYTLTVPADALLSDQVIRMMPLAAVDALPMTAGLVAGVHLEPEGLRLLKSATLTIEGAPAVDGGLPVTGFGYQATGSEFHLRRLATNGATYSMQINHFSGYGVTAGTAQEVQAQVANHAPTAPDDAARQRQVAAPATFQELFEWYEGFIYKDLTRGRDGDTEAMESAIVYFQAWLELVREAGLEAEYAELIETGWKHLLLGLANNIERAYAQCKAGDAAQVVRVLRWSRIVRMLPAAPRREWISDNYMNTTMKNMAEGCATFELDFDSQLAQDVPDVPHVGQAHTSHVRAEGIRVQFNLETRLNAPVQAPLNYVSFKLAGDHPECTSSTVAPSGTLTVVNGRINLNYGLGGEPKFNIYLRPDRLDETITYYCPAGVIQVIEPIFWYTGLWMLNWYKVRGDLHAFDFSQWNFVGTSLYAEMIRDVPPSADTLHYHGTTWLVLAHTPE